MRRIMQASCPSMPSSTPIEATTQLPRTTTNGPCRSGPRSTDPRSPLHAEIQLQLGLAVAALGDADAALRLAAAAESAGREHLQVMLRSLPERQALNYAAARPRGLNLLLSLSRSPAEAVPPALDTLIRSRGLLLDAIAAWQGAGRASIAPTDPLWIAFTSAQQRLANLMVRGPWQMSSTQYLDLIETARRDSESAEWALTERSAKFRAERNRALTGLDDVKAALPPDAALVSFVRYDRAVFDARKPMPGGGGSLHRPIPIVPLYMAFVLPPSAGPVALHLGSVKPIDTLVKDRRQAIVAIGDTADVFDTSRVAGASLRARVWDPVARHLGKARRVFDILGAGWHVESRAIRSPARGPPMVPARGRSGDSLSLC